MHRFRFRLRVPPIRLLFKTKNNLPHSFSKIETNEVRRIIVRHTGFRAHPSPHRSPSAQRHCGDDRDHRENANQKRHAENQLSDFCRVGNLMGIISDRQIHFVVNPLQQISRDIRGEAA